GDVIRIPDRAHHEMHVRQRVVGQQSVLLIVQIDFAVRLFVQTEAPHVSHNSDNGYLRIRRSKSQQVANGIFVREESASEGLIDQSDRLRRPIVGGLKYASSTERDPHYLKVVRRNNTILDSERLI